MKSTLKVQPYLGITVMYEDGEIMERALEKRRKKFKEGCTKVNK